jgi:peptidoglycan/LPS O-acetylase OafA/YrhL
VGLGVALLWFATPILGLGMMGDCGMPPTPECESYRGAVQAHAWVSAIVVLANSALALLALLVRRPQIVVALLIAAVVTLALAILASRPRDAGSPLPVFMGAVVPGALLIMAGASWQLRSDHHSVGRLPRLP